MTLKLPPIPENLQPGQQTAQWVLDVITSNPDNHDQNVFERRNWCGTTRCVAGWAIYAHNPDNISIYDRNHGDDSTHDGAKYLRLELDDYGQEPRNEAVQRYLENSGDGMTLFYCTDNRQAVKALEFLAAGEPIDWDAVYDNGRDIW